MRFVFFLQRLAPHLGYQLFSDGRPGRLQRAEPWDAADDRADCDERVPCHTAGILATTFCDAIDIYKNDHLPRQARDKHRENSKRRVAFPQVLAYDIAATSTWCDVLADQLNTAGILSHAKVGNVAAECTSKVENAYLLQCHFMLIVIISPRQARDKHRETQKEMCCLTVRDGR